jgi:hypothetical protein
VYWPVLLATDDILTRIIATCLPAPMHLAMRRSRADWRQSLARKLTLTVPSPPHQRRAMSFEAERFPGARCLRAPNVATDAIKLPITEATG